MNYIILNGKRSDSITGLLIQSLPPISKPLLRTEVEEIDGRDGDIITPLGYSAYDKEMSIGLYGKFEIDKVIGFFDSEGTVIFSNEPDKLYFYKIIEQIDFERLIRYRTATVTLHVQPFKFSAVDGVYTYNNSVLSISADYTKTVNGVTLSVSDGTINLSGSSTSTAEFFIPISTRLMRGRYSLTATGDAVEGRVGYGLMAGADTFGLSFYDGNYSKEFVLTEDRDIQFLWVCVYGTQTVSADIHISLTGTGINVINLGNVKSKPIMTIYGSGRVALSVNGGNPFVLTLGSDPIRLDVSEVQAYYPDGSFANRRTYGDYDDLWLNAGDNLVTWTGDVEKILFERHSRWI